MSKKPPLLIHSSVEGLSIAHVIQVNLDRVCACKVWNQGVFAPGRSNIDSILNEAQAHDYAVIVITADDTKNRRGVEERSPSDNVILEVGLYIGILGLRRTFIVCDRDEQPKLPTNLDGIGVITYSLVGHSSLRAALGAACTEIEELIRNDWILGPPPPVKVV